ncbi:hypothetical protein JW998_13115 [candidate division KSB1 bacterium]|nr:hypothetical protein [candidate division KSB1 bacterium]
MKKRCKSVLLWITALIITLLSAVYQRQTGPTYPIVGVRQIDDSEVHYELLRSHGGDGDQPVVIVAADTAVRAAVVFRRYKTDDFWTRTEMQRQGDELVAALPHQPPAGKLEYHVEIRKDDAVLNIPEKENAITRFKGDVPAWALLPHILFMFLAMLLSTRTGLQSLRKATRLPGFVLTTILFVIIGGFIFGPIVQKYAFGAYWTGLPFGADLTDNKTLIALAAWVVAFIMIRRRPTARLWALGAALVMLLIFLIPHSMHGSELDYNTIDAEERVSRTGQ